MADVTPLNAYKPQRSRSIGRIIPSRTDSGNIPQSRRDKSSTRSISTLQHEYSSAAQDENRSYNEQDDAHKKTIIHGTTERNTTQRRDIRDKSINRISLRNNSMQRGLIRDRSTQRKAEALHTLRAKSNQRSILKDNVPVSRDKSRQRIGLTSNSSARKLDTTTMKTPNIKDDSHLRSTARSQTKYGTHDTPSMQSRGRLRSRSIHHKPVIESQLHVNSEEDCDEGEDEFDEEYDKNLPDCEIVEILWNKLLRLELSRLAQSEVQAKIRAEQEIEAIESAKLLEQVELELYEIQSCGPIYDQLMVEWEHAQNQQAIQRLLLTQSANPVSDKISSIVSQVESLMTVTDTCDDIIGLMKECHEISKGWKVSSEAERLWSQELAQS